MSTQQLYDLDLCNSVGRIERSELNQASYFEKCARVPIFLATTVYFQNYTTRSLEGTPQLFRIPHSTQTHPNPHSACSQTPQLPSYP